MTDDLFAGADAAAVEHAEERAAICQFDGNMTQEEAWALARHEAEVAWCMRTFYPDGQAMKAHFDDIEKKRGKAGTDKLRDDVRKAWASRTATVRQEGA